MRKKTGEGAGTLSIANKDGDIDGELAPNAFLEAYKKQNPKKYEEKLAKGELKLPKN